jgi:hypothetical protein
MPRRDDCLADRQASGTASRLPAVVTRGTRAGVPLLVRRWSEVCQSGRRLASANMSAPANAFAPYVTLMPAPVQGVELPRTHDRVPPKSSTRALLSARARLASTALATAGVAACLAAVSPSRDLPVAPAPQTRGRTIRAGIAAGHLPAEHLAAAHLAVGARRPSWSSTCRRSWRGSPSGGRR